MEWREGVSDEQLAYLVSLLMAAASVFAHNRDVMSGNDLAIGQAVSFVIEEGLKGSSAKKIHQEEGGELVLEDESERLYGKVKVLLSILQLLL